MLRITESIEVCRFVVSSGSSLFCSARAAVASKVGVSVTILLAIFLFISFSTNVDAAWFSKKKKEEPYIAKVGTVSIKLADFENSVRKLHTSSRVGKALTKGTSFEKHSFAKYLDELIDNELMALECVRLGLDKEEDFQRLIYSFKLNLFLGELKREEILEKVKVTEHDIKAELELQGITEDPEAQGEESAKKADPHSPTTQPRQAALKKLTKIKNKAREVQFFKELREQASINIKTKALKAFSSTDEKLHTRVVAVVDGEKILAIELLRELRGKSQHDAKLLRKTLDNLILHKLLDKEAFGRGYESLPTVQASIEKYRRKRLLDLFNRRVILPLVKIEEEDIMQYYKDNPEEFSTPASYKLRMIFVGEELEIASIVSELKRGADFGYLARERSLDPTKDKMGELGWVSAARLSVDIAMAAANASDGDLIGPFKMEYGHSVMERLDAKPGDLKPYNSVRADIDRKLGAEKFIAIHKKYLKRLRKTVPIKINEKALKEVIIVRPKEG